MEPRVKEALKGLAWELKELDLGSKVDVHMGPPSPLYFYQQYVAPNKPVILKSKSSAGLEQHRQLLNRKSEGLICVMSDCLGSWPALEKWSTDYLRKKIGDKRVPIEITPNGRADAVTATVDENGNSINVFAEPFQEEMSFGYFLDFLQQSKTCNPQEVPYMQHQNNNLKKDFPELFEDIDVSGPQWATNAFGDPPEAVNLWIGDERSVTSFHKDHYENIYAVLRGTKVFTLLPPSAAFRMHIEKYPAAKYERNQEGHLHLVTSVPTTEVPWSPIELSADGLQAPEEGRWPNFYADDLPGPIQCSVSEGDILYLPSLWYHHVQQIPGNLGCVIAVNFWYNMRYDLKYAYYKLIEKLSDDERKMA